MKRRSFLGFLLAAPVLGTAVARAVATPAMASPLRGVSGVRRMVLGKGANGSFGMQISKPGIDVLSDRVPMFSVGHLGGAPSLCIRGDMIVDGAIAGKPMHVGSLSAFSADLTLPAC